MSYSSQTKKKWDRNARFYDMMTFFETKGQTARIRRKMLEGCTGKILEVGLGTGHNLEFYPCEPSLSIIGIDISDAMLRKASRKGCKEGKKVMLNCMDAENLAFKDASFDYVVSTCVFCSIPDPVKGFREIARVLKTQGRLLMYEHVISKNKLLAFLQNLANPLFVRIGPNINRDTLGNLEIAGFRVVKEENMRLKDIFKRIDAIPPTAA